MGAAVRIEAAALSDTRFKVLAKLRSYQDSDLALMKCARIWAYQTDTYTPDEPTYIVSEDVIEAELGPGGAEDMVKAKLAERKPTGFRIKGSEGRIEWLWKKRNNGKKGGRPSKSANPGEEKPTGYPTGSSQDNRMVLSREPKPNPPTLTLSPSEISDLSSSPRDPTVPEPVPEPVVRTPERAPDRSLDEHRQVINAVWSAMLEARAQAAPKCLNNGPGPGALPSGPLCDKLRHRLAQLVDAGLNYRGATEQLQHAVAIAAAKAERDQNLRHFATVFDDDDFARALETTTKAIAEMAPSALAQGSARQRREAHSRAGPKAHVDHTPRPKFRDM